MEKSAQGHTGQPVRDSSLGDLVAKRKAEAGASAAAAGANGPAGFDGVCLTVSEASCFGFELELADRSVRAFAYHYFRTAVLSPKGDELVLELLEFKVTFRGERLIHVLRPLRRGLDLAVRVVPARYASTIESDQPAVTEIQIEEKAEDAAVPAPPASGEDTEPLRGSKEVELRGKVSRADLP